MGEAAREYMYKHITKTCPCNIQTYFSALKIENFIGKVLINLICLLKTLIVGARSNEHPQSMF